MKIFDFFKKKNKDQKKNIKVLRLEYDFLYKCFIFINWFFIIYFWLFSKDISYKSFNILNWWDWNVIIFYDNIFYIRFNNI